MNIFPKLNLLLLSTAALSSCGNKQVTNQVRPNILYIMCDDHSYQTISSYGSEVSKLAPTPNIDRIANEGMLFDRAFVENSLSAPSRACLMTGLYSHQNGQEQLWEGIDSTKTFFTELLHEAGYETGIVGKWHLLCEPKGFDYYHILDGQGQYYNPTFKSSEGNGEFVEEKGYATSLVTKHAIEFLDQRNKEKPFCLMVNHKAPHRNWMPEQKYLNLYENVEFPIPETFWDDFETRGLAALTQKLNIANAMEMIQDLKVEEMYTDSTNLDAKFSHISLMKELGRLSSEERAAWDKHYKPRNKKLLDAKLTGKELTLWKYQNYMKDYLRCIKSVDDSVGELLNYLEKEGLLENTIIVYTSDQGFWMGEHGWFDKRFMYEESFRTPLLVRYPDKIVAGSKCKELVQNIDFAPTLLDVAGLKVPETMQGRSLVPLFAGNKLADWRKSIYYHYYDYPTFHLVNRHDGVRTDRYKLIHFYGKGGEAGASPNMLKPGTQENRMFNMLKNANYFPASSVDVNYNELYDLQEDPQELNNLYGKPGYEQITAELQELLNNYRNTLKVEEY